MISKMLGVWCGVAAVVLAANMAGAQDLRKVQPPATPRLVQPPGNTNAGVPTIIKAGAFTNEAVILKELKGVVFLPDQSLVSTGAFTASSGFDVSKVPMLQVPLFAEIAPSFIGLPASKESLERLATSVRIFLAQQGYPFSAAYLPPQDITEGHVQIVVHLAKADAGVRVEGARYFSTNLYLRAIRQQPGEIVNAVELKEDIDWLNRNPYRYTTFVAARGQQPGTTTIALRTQERFPLRVNAGYNNTGTRVSDEERLTAGFSWGNAFWQGHQMSYQYSASPDFHTTTAHSGDYAIDLPWRHSLRLLGAYSELHGKVAPPFNQTGRSWQAGLRYEIPLPRLLPGFSQRLSLGGDFKASDNNLLFGPIPVTDNLTHVIQLVAGYDAGLSDRWGRTDFGVAFTASPGGLTANNDQPFFNTSRAGAEPQYALGMLSLSRATRLPWGLTWSVRGQIQWATGNLLGSEQLGAGGSGSVRGYEEGEVFGDEGYLLRNEISLPAWKVLERLGLGAARDQFQIFGFQDYARVSNVELLPGEPRGYDLHSLGVGARYNVRENLSVNFAYGWQLVDSTQSRTGENSRAHLAVQVSY